MNHTSEAVKHLLQEQLEKENTVLAVWEGGSAATGYLDQYSDLDLLIVINGSDANAIFQMLETHFENNYGILKQFRMPEPAWHGMSQCFYLLKDCPLHFYCDIAVVCNDNPSKFTETDRHGNAVIWFDKANIFESKKSSKEELESIRNRAFAAATATDWLAVIELQKALSRKNWIASQMNYITFIYRHLVPLMNLKYRPCKADFGIRYADRDYPIEAAAFLEDLLRITCVADIEFKLPAALAMFEELKQTQMPKT